MGWSGVGSGGVGGEGWWNSDININHNNPSPWPSIAELHLSGPISLGPTFSAITSNLHCSQASQEIHDKNVANLATKATDLRKNGCRYKFTYSIRRSYGAQRSRALGIHRNNPHLAPQIPLKACLNCPDSMGNAPHITQIPYERTPR